MKPSPLVTKRRRWSAVALLLATGVGLAMVDGFAPWEGNLFDGSLLTGWILIVLLAALCACVWSPRRSLPALGVQLRWVAMLTALAAMLFAGHIQSFPPTGILDQCLAWTFVGLLASSAWGYRLSLLLEDQPTLAHRQSFHAWLYVQAMVLGLLLGGGAVHGMLIHTHGMMAKALTG